ncbi:14481_t:CDS:1 [Entrophospora sp. SA101]|nr:20140_t:CDS:1 [Entrophospora sp. SA101]CAJ0831097.1 7849_t:CDS:1 [Entrophospora sp. SA101]CAJ0838863.1 14481_t:CDS:1 [Entrophospora sp. SA101]CAJ0842577.1 4348_t:CDS:1 [Entrophospora sp. SA101]
MFEMNHLPNELLLETLKFLEKVDLISCSFVNRYWHRLCMMLLWIDPLVSKYNLKVLINYFARNTLLQNNIRLNFQSLENQPFENYLMFVKKLSIFAEIFQDLIKEKNIGRKRQYADLLIKDLVVQVLKSSRIEEIFLSGLNPYLPNDFHNNEEFHFEDVKILHYKNTDSPELLKKFVGIVSEIHKLCLEITKNDEADDGLDRLINRQSKLRILHLLVEKGCTLSANTLKALLDKSDLLTEFKGYVHAINEMMGKGAIFPNMRKLELFNYYDDGNISMSYFKRAKFSQLEELHFQFNAEGDIDDFIQFIKQNSLNLKTIMIHGNPDKRSFGKFISEIAGACQRLKYLSIPYHHDHQASLTLLFENCVELETISLKNFMEDNNCDFDKVIDALITIGQKKLHKFLFEEIFKVSDNGLKKLKNWEVIPIKISIEGYEDEDNKLIELLKKHGFYNTYI